MEESTVIGFARLVAFKGFIAGLYMAVASKMDYWSRFE